jgi:hypothetical protein
MNTKISWLVVSAGIIATTLSWGQEVSAGKWRLSGGASTRSIGTDFHMNAPSALTIGRDTSGKGDVGFYNGTTSILSYDDGHLGKAYGYGSSDNPSWYDGTCYGVIENASQLQPTSRSYSGAINYDELTFHTTLSVNESSYTATPYDGSDDKTEVAPFLQMRRELGQVAGLSIGILAGYAFVQSEASSGQRQLAQHAVNRRTTTYAYTYDHIGLNSGATAPGAVFPFEDDGAYTVFDVPYANSSGYTSGADTPALAPRKTMSSALRGRSLYTAYGQVDTALDLHEIILAPELTLPLGKTVVLGLSVGPTINIIDARIDASRRWVRNGVTEVSEQADGDNTDVKIGAAADLSVFIDFTSRFFGQLSAGYRYVPTINLDAGSIASSEIDASSFQGSAGIGIRL